MKFIFGYKQEMTQQYREDGSVVPVTAVKAEPIIVTQVKTIEKEGYNAIQFGLGERKKIRKSQKGHLAPILEAGRKPFKSVHEFRVDDSSKFKVGDSLGVESFQPGDKVNVSGVSKGKGFQGVVKRHGFKGGPASHGHKDQERMPGSIGAQDAQRVFKGMKMGGRMGGDNVTVKNLEIISVDPEACLIYVKGALPGARNSIVEIFGAGEIAVMTNILEKKKEVPAAETSEISEKSTAEDSAPDEGISTDSAETTAQQEDKEEKHEETKKDENQPQAE